MKHRVNRALGRWFFSMAPAKTSNPSDTVTDCTCGRSCSSRHTVATLRCRVTLTRIRVSLAVVKDAQTVNTSRPSLLVCHTRIVRFAVAVVSVVGGDCGALVVRSSFDAVPLAPSFCQSVSGCDASLGLPTCAVWRVVPLSPRCWNGIALLFLSRTPAALGGRQAGVATVGEVLVWLSGTCIPHWTQRRNWEDCSR